MTAAGSELSGVPNFHKVNDQVYRGAQPSAEGFRNLARLGVKTVIDLRSRSASEQRKVEAAGMRYIAMPWSGYNAPTADQMSRLLALLHDSAAGPVFVHCRRGADRTGTAIACYRIMHDHWDNRKALTEAKSCGMSLTERLMQQFVLAFQAPPTEAPPVATALPIAQ
ncbi:MAG: tyrosine-protein phosphatase [Acidobacteriia bacterium]|nr:tyrosine-protein phosphatase [Terriglobia bacterium]